MLDQSNVVEKKWDFVLSRLKTVFPDAIIAGGALRDKLLGNKVKDIDIFATTDLQPDKVEEKIIEVLGLEGTFDKVTLTQDFDAITSDDSGYGELNTNTTDIRQIFDFTYDSELYQFMVVKVDPVEMVYQHFDFGICKVLYDGDVLDITDDFWYDYEHKQITMSGTFYKPQITHTILTHKPNLEKKFPNWTFVIGDVHEQKPEKEEKPELSVTYDPDDITDGDSGWINAAIKDDLREFQSIPRGMRPSKQYKWENIVESKDKDEWFIDIESFVNATAVDKKQCDDNILDYLSKMDMTFFE